MTKLAKSTLPTGHTVNDFKCFGPPATKDGEFEGTMLCEMGCFSQGEDGDDEAVDSNKYYFGCVCQSTINSKYYFYVEYGRVGTTNPQFQFVEYNSEADAKTAYCKQLHEKNDKRGEWHNHKVLGKILRPKSGKDCYLVRSQTTRNTGLPDSKTITLNQPIVQKTKMGNIKSTTIFDPISSKLLSDLNTGTISYTRSSIVGNALPSQDAITEGRAILNHAQDIVNQGGNAKELKELSQLLYSRIPKIKKVGDTDWILDGNKIPLWHDDLNAFETALIAENNSQTTINLNLPYHIKHVQSKEKLFSFVSDFFEKSTRNKHSYIGKLNLLNIFEINRKRNEFISYGKNIFRNDNKEIPLHQPQNRIDLSDDEKTLFQKNGTFLLWHGSRSVNCSNILKEGLRLPKTLSNVAISGSLLGSLCYVADDRNKSVGYTSYKNSYWGGGSGGLSGRGAFMFICDVILGNIYVAPRPHPYVSYPTNYHSIMGKMNFTGSLQNNEYVILPQQINLRYLIEFN